MRNGILILLAGGLVLLASTAVSANWIELLIIRGDMNHDGTPDLFFGDIDVQVTGATAVQISPDDGTTWLPFEGDGGEFWFETEADTLANLLAGISGPKILRVFHDGANSPSRYGFRINDDQAAINARFPVPLPRITGLSWIANTATLSWDWTGEPDQVNSLEVWAEGGIGANWQIVYDKSSDDDPPNDIDKDIHQVDDILFPSPPGSYDYLELVVTYMNQAHIGSGNEVAISDWTHLSGDVLFGGPEDVTEYFGSGDEVPEPATTALLALGGLAFLRRRRAVLKGR